MDIKNRNIDTADLGIKRKIIGSIFSENIVFDGKQHRIAPVNEFFRAIYQINSMIAYKKNKSKVEKINFGPSC
ncbi:hypothetical protein [Echinicola shivajiensis]|uniref:hypothetical protein n=1 Tax=Echinicola shivajiensis TaxID=1035916 RepID=UPI001BFCD08E|nr:hypothetical protein [Echinicola shivajiensis]